MQVQKVTKQANRNILVITDFSESSTNAILFAAQLFQYSNLKFVLLNVFQTPGDNDTLLISVEDILTKDSETGLKKQSAEIASALKNQKISISTHSLSGKLNKAIARITETENIDLIVSGISDGKYPHKLFADIPFLFMGQSKYPVLLVPEQCSDKPLGGVLTINFDSSRQQNMLNNDLEHIINHDHISKYILTINEKKIDSKVKDSIQTMLTRQEIELIIFIPSPGDKINKAMLDYRIQELCPDMEAILSI